MCVSRAIKEAIILYHHHKFDAPTTTSHRRAERQLSAGRSNDGSNSKVKLNRSGFIYISACAEVPIIVTANGLCKLSKRVQPQHRVIVPDLTPTVANFPE